MKKISIIKETVDILSTVQMSVIKGGTASVLGSIDNSDLMDDDNNIGSLNIMEGEKRPKRPGGGISTH